MTVTKHINLQTFRDNLVSIVEQMKPARVMAVIKADAYGHGLVECAKEAAALGIDILGVLDIETGLALRSVGVSTPAFAWLHSPISDFASAVDQGIELSASSIEELEAIAKVPGKASIHLKIDTGLSRNGCRVEFWPTLVARAIELQQAGEIQLVAVWSHLSGASIEADNKSKELFDAAIDTAKELGFDGYRHLASSPGAFAYPDFRYDMVRIGVAAFGTSPVTGCSAKDFGLRNPMMVTAELISPNTISIGYLHGYFSSLAGKSNVVIDGKKFAITKIDALTSQIKTTDAQVGSVVRIFGDEDTDVTAEELCDLVETVTDELFTGLKTELVSYSS